MLDNLKFRDEAQINFGTDSRLRLATIVRLRWIGVLGQILAVGTVYLLLGFDLPAGACLICIAMSAWVNVYFSVRYPARHRLSINFATALLAYDIIQLAALLFLTGGIANPFMMLIVAPVTVSAASLPLRHTVALGILAMAATTFLTFYSLPLPWNPASALELPLLYRFGILAAAGASMAFLALYVWRLTKEGRQMSAALAATELVLAREQKLHALDGLAAAAAHELGTPLSTITLVTHELSRQMGKGDPHWDDIVLLRDQAQRCREILQKLTRHPPDEDPLHASLTVQEMLHEAAQPYLGGQKILRIRANPAAGVTGPAARQPQGLRRPGVIYGLGNLIENATDFAARHVDINAEWDGQAVSVVISDDGPGFKADVIDALGEPYVTTRPSGARKPGGTKASGLGLGFFIAKTLLERSGAHLTLSNHVQPRKGAIVHIMWRREDFEARLPARGSGEEWQPRTTPVPPPGEATNVIE